MRLLAIDPGSTESGFVVYEPDLRTHRHELGTILEHGVVDNEILLARCWRTRDAGEHHLAIELINVFGKANSDVFRTCIWHGRFIEAWGAEGYSEITRNTVKAHLCGTARSNDSDVRAALIDRWGGEAAAIGGKGRGAAKTPRGPLHGIASHAWSALAVAVVWSDTQNERTTAA